jgi:NTP pyrophosphatase (non-canonical NTP hydrolase)
MSKPTWFDRADKLHRAIVNHRVYRGQPVDVTAERKPYGDDDGIFLAMGLAGEAGEVANEFKKWMRGDYTREEFTAKLRGELGDVRVMLELVARYAGLDLDEVTEEKLAVVEARWRARGILK